MNPATALATDNPFVGPRALQATDPIFGRDRELRDLKSLLISERVVLLNAASGAGKTSLIQAGLLPALQEAFDEILPIMQVYGQVAIGRKPRNAYTYQAIGCLEAARPTGAPSGELDRLTLEEYLAWRDADGDGVAWREFSDALPPAGLASSKGVRLPAHDTDRLLVFDEFEEVLTAHPADVAEKIEFFQELGAVLRSRNWWAVFSMRHEYVAALEPYLHFLPTRLATRMHLEPLSPDAAKLAIVEPVRRQGVEFAPAALELLINDLRLIRIQKPDARTDIIPGPFVEPVHLQVVCHRLWEALGGAQLITPEHIRGSVKVKRALQEFYDQAVRRTAKDTGVAERAMREWFDLHLITPEGFRGQVMLQPNESQGLKNEAIRLLNDEHLVRTDRRRGITWFELAHDRLIDPVRDSNVEWFAKNLHGFQQRALAWWKGGRDEKNRGSDLTLSVVEDLISWAEEPLQELSLIDQGFLDACRNTRARLIDAQRFREVVETTAARLAAEALVQAYRGQLDLGLLLAQEAFNARVSPSSRPGEAAVTALLTLLGMHPQLETYLRGHEDMVYAVAFDPTGRFVASSGRRGMVIVWDAHTWQPIVTERAHTQAVDALAFNAEGTQLASASRDGKIQLWDLESGKRTFDFQATTQKEVRRLAFSPDGALLAAAGKMGLVLWDLQSQPPVEKRWLQQESAVLAVAFKRDGSLFSGGDDRQITCWDPVAGVVLHQLPTCHEDDIYALASSRDGEWLASGGKDGQVLLWDLKAAETEPYRVAKRDGVIWSVSFSPNASLLAFSGGDKTTILWDLETRRFLGPPLAGHSDQVNEVAFGPHGAALVTCADDKTVILWNLPKRQPLIGHSGNVTSLCFSQDGRRLITADRHGTVLVWECEWSMVPPTEFLPIRKWSLPPQKGEVSSVAICPAGRILAFGVNRRSDSQIYFYDLETRSQSSESVPWHGAFMNLAFSPDGQLLAAGGGDGTLFLLESQTGHARAQVRQHQSCIWQIAFSPGRTHLVSASRDRTLRLWDTEAGEVIGIFQKGGDVGLSHRDDVTCVTFSPDGECLASGGLDKQIHLWHANSLQHRGTLQGHTGQIQSLDFSPDGRTLVSGGRDGLVILWDLEKTPLCGLPLQGHSGGVQCVRFHPYPAGAEGIQTVVSGGEDMAILAWRVGLHDWEQRACRIANRNLTTEEWARFLGQNPYRPTCPELAWAADARP